MIKHLALHLTMILLLFFGVFNYSFVILTFSFVYKRVSYLCSFISWVKITSLLVILLPISSYLFIHSIADRMIFIIFTAVSKLWHGQVINSVYCVQYCFQIWFENSKMNYCSFSKVFQACHPRQKRFRLVIMNSHQSSQHNQMYNLLWL